MNSRLLPSRNSVRIARVEFRRSVRAIGGNPIQLIAFGLFALLFVGGPTVGGVYVVLHFGEALTTVLSVEGVRTALTFVWLVSTIMIAQRAVGKTGRIDHVDGMLTTTPVVDIVGGLLLAEYARLLAVVSLPVVAISAALAYGLGAPTTFVTVVVALFALFTTGLLTGHLLGVSFKIVLDGSELLTRYKSLLAVIAFVVYLIAVSSDGFGRLVTHILAVLEMLPMGWFGDLLAVGVPTMVPSSTRVASAIALFVIGVPILFALDVSASTHLWYADRAQPTVREHSSSSVDVRFLPRIASGPTQTVLASVWRRTIRGPLRLIYVVYPLLLLFGPLRDAVTTGRVPSSLPVFLAFYGTWAIGAAALNPLGDEGTTLPITVTSTIRGRQFVRGHVLSVAVIGLPILATVTASTGFLSPLEPVVWLPLTAATAYLAVAGTVVALAIGSAFPRFGEVRVTQSRRVVVPSKTAFAYYTLVLGIGFVSTIVALVPGAASVLSNAIAFWTTVLGSTIEVDVTLLRIGGGVIGLLLIVVAPILAYQYATRRFDTYTL